MKILVVGSGGREHALCVAFSASAFCNSVFCAPGNDGIRKVAVCIPISEIDFSRIIEFCILESIDLVVIGPATPLLGGLVDRLVSAGIRAFGPTRAAAKLEASKLFMKSFCQRHQIPTADYLRFDNAERAMVHLGHAVYPVVIKTDTPSDGEGVRVCRTASEALDWVDQTMVKKRFGGMGSTILLEDFIDGEELSFFVLVGNKAVVPFGEAQDYKMFGDNDTGANTGGMGATSPVSWVTEKLRTTIMNTIIMPAVDGLKSEGIPFQGVLYAGLMIRDGDPWVLEFNVRFGDPELQALCARLKSDLLGLILAILDGPDQHLSVEWSAVSSLCAVMVAKDYSGRFARGTEIRGISRAERKPGVSVSYYNMKFIDEKWLSFGKRALCVTSAAIDFRNASARVYDVMQQIDWPEGHYRKDIGWRELTRPDTTGGD